MAEPACHRRRDLIADRVAEQSRVTFHCTHVFTDNGFNIWRFLVGVDQITDVLLRGESHHNPQTMAKRDVEQGARRHRMRNSDCVDSVHNHQCEVLLDLRRVVVLAFANVGPKSTVTDAFDVKLLRANVYKFPNDTWSD